MDERWGVCCEGYLYIGNSCVVLFAVMRWCWCVVLCGVAMGTYGAAMWVPLTLLLTGSMKRILPVLLLQRPIHAHMRSVANKPVPWYT